MAVPKRRTSRANTRSRRANWLKLKPVNYAKCPVCQSPKLSHTACDTCGQYNGHQVIEASAA